MTILDIKKLPFASKAGICWGFFWRGVAMTVLSSLCGAVLGAVVGFFFAFAGLPREAARIAAGALGACCGAYFFYLYVQWLLTRRMGQFRIVLIGAGDEN